MSNSSSSSTSGNSPPSSSSDDSNDSPSSGSSPPSPSSNSSPPSPSSSSSSSSSSSPLSPKASPPPPNSSPPPPSDDDDSPSPPPPSSSSSSSSPSNSKSPPPPQNSSPPPSPPKNSPSPPSGSSPSDDDNSPSTPSDNNNSPSTPSDDDNSPSTPSLVTPPSSRGGNSPSDSDPSSTPAISDSPPIPRGSQPNGIGSTSPSRPSNNTPSSNNSQGGGALVGVVVVGVVVVLFAMCCIVMMRKRRRGRMDALDYRPPTSISIRSDGGYYKQTNTLGGSARSDSYHVSQQHHGASGMMGGGSNRYGYHSGPMDMAHTGSTSFFSYEELVDATGGFSLENMIGEGGFGCVYKGTLPDGRKIAVKQLKAGSGQGEREFQAEVETISRVHHRHLVTLVGYCISEYHRLLVYEFLPNNTLEHHLHAKGLPAMEWDKRMKIAIGSAKGFAYLHEDCHPKIIHRDIKSANILLEDSFEPQVADFGLAKLSNDTHTHVSTRVMGTFGYLAPEYASSGKLTDRSDVFSFGVVLLEIITGRKPVDSTRPYGDESLVEWARPLLVRALETGNCDELVDPRLEGNYNKAEMFNMIEAAAACVRHSAPKRPRMVQVVRALDRQDDMPDLTNGVKYGQSQGFTPAQQSADMQRFRRMAFGNDTDNYEYESGEYDRRSAGGYSGEYRSREHRPPPPPQPNSWCSPPDPNTYDSDTKAMFRSERSTGGGGVQNYRNF